MVAWAENLLCCCSWADPSIDVEPKTEKSYSDFMCELSQQGIAIVLCHPNYPKLLGLAVRNHRDELGWSGGNFRRHQRRGYCGAFNDNMARDAVGAQKWKIEASTEIWKKKCRPFQQERIFQDNGHVKKTATTFQDCSHHLLCVFDERRFSHIQWQIISRSFQFQNVWEMRPRWLIAKLSEMTAVMIARGLDLFGR